MKFKLFLFALAVLACIVCNSAVDTLQPSLDAAVAVDQFQDSEIAAQTARGLFRLETTVSLVSWLATGVFGLLLFRKDIQTVTSRLITGI